MLIMLKLTKLVIDIVNSWHFSPACFEAQYVWSCRGPRERCWIASVSARLRCHRTFWSLSIVHPQRSSLSKLHLWSVVMVEIKESNMVFTGRLGYITYTGSLKGWWRQRYQTWCLLQIGRYNLYWEFVVLVEITVSNMRFTGRLGDYNLLKYCSTL